MKRRMLLGAMAAGSLSGCIGELDGFLGEDEPDCPEAYDQIDFEPVEDVDEAILGGPECPRGTPVHPVYGDSFPSFSVPDALTEETIESHELYDDSPLVMTFIFTNCPDRCPELMGILQIIQDDAITEGWDDDVTLAAMTWDPERDGADELRDYGEVHGIDVDHEQFHLLRPETNEEAIDLVDDTLGVPAQHGDHDHDHDDHEHDDHDDHGAGDAHYYMIFIVNTDGIVERSYPGPILWHRSPDDISQAVSTVVNNDA